MDHLFHYMPIDKTDIIIIDILKQTSKLSMRAIAKKAHIPITTVYHRIKKLENEHVIQKYTIQVDEKKLGNVLTAYVLVHYSLGLSNTQQNAEVLNKQLRRLPGVEEIKYITGRYDLLLKIRSKSIEEFNNKTLLKLREIIELGRTETFFVLDEAK